MVRKTIRHRNKSKYPKNSIAGIYERQIKIHGKKNKIKEQRKAKRR